LIFHIIVEHVQSWLKLYVLLQTVHIGHLTMLECAINANGAINANLEISAMNAFIFYD